MKIKNYLSAVLFFLVFPVTTFANNAPSSTTTASNANPASNVKPEDDPMQPCFEDIKSYCNHLKSKKKQIACLLENRSKVATACLKVIEKKSYEEKKY